MNGLTNTSHYQLHRDTYYTNFRENHGPINGFDMCIIYIVKLSA